MALKNDVLRVSAPLREKKFFLNKVWYSRGDAEAQGMREDEIGTIVIETAIAVMKSGITRCVNGLEE